MIREIKKLAQLHGVSKLSADLGYRSPATIYWWLRTNKIPDTAKVRVREYLEGERACLKKQSERRSR
jgi:hypothetical protein